MTLESLIGVIMGRKSNSKQIVKKDSPKEFDKVLIKRRKELAVLVDKLLKLTSVFQTSITFAKLWEHFLEIDGILKKIKELEAAIRNQSSGIDRNDNIEQFMKWLKESGASFEGVEIAEFPGYELGLKAKKDFKEESLILTVPRKLLLTQHDALESELKAFITVDPLLQTMPNITLSLYLLLIKSDPDSFWTPYINVLPQKYSTILYFSAEDFAELKPSPVLEQSLKLFRSIARQYAYFYNKVFTMDLPVVKKLRDIYCYENYRWAVTTVMTRQNNVRLTNYDTNAFIPLWDMCNHENGKITTDYNTERDQAECYALRDFQEGEQIFIYYGSRPNSGLFLHNGFVYPNNDTDCLSLALGVSASDPLRDTKLVLLSKLGLGNITHFTLFNTNIPISPEMLAFIRIFNMNKDELSRWLTCRIPGDLVSPEPVSSSEVGAVIENKAYSYLLTRCNLLRAGYQVKNPVGENGETSVVRNNIKLLKECELKILDKTIKYVKEMLEKFPIDKKIQ